MGTDLFITNERKIDLSLFFLSGDEFFKDLADLLERLLLQKSYSFCECKTSPTRGGGFQNRGPLKAVISKDYLTT